MEQYGIYFNFLSIGAVISTLISSFCAVFLFRMKNKSQSTKVLAVFFTIFAIFVASYFWAHSLYHPYAAWHRWFTVFFSLVSLTSFLQFMWVYPKDTHKKIRKYILISQSVIVIAIQIFFVLVTLNKKIIFFSEGQYFDFDAQGASRVVAAVIGLFILLVIATTIYRTFIQKIEKRWVVLTISLLFTITTVIPGITNLRSRSGELSRDVHQTVFTFLMVLVAFSIFITYLNNTTDKSTFLAKILGITMVTFFILMLGLGYLYLNDREQSFDKLQIAYLEKTIASKHFKELHNLEYVRAVKKRENGFHYQTKFQRKKLDLSKFDEELLNTIILHELQSTESKKFSIFSNKVKELLSHSHTGFKGYKQVLKKLLLKKNKKEFLTLVDQLRRELYIHRNKILMIEEVHFKSKIAKALSKFTGLSLPFKKVIESKLNSMAKDTTNKLVKATVLEYLTPLNPEKHRHIREVGQERFIAFSVVVKENGEDVLYEAGFNYPQYRQYVHRSAFTMLIILVMVFFGILFIFPMFFRGNLLNPLNELLEGVKRVNEGDFQSSIPIRINDEIGFLSSSFNMMVGTVKEGKEKLEDRVKERTFKLKTTLDEVQLLKEKQDGDYFLTTLLIKPLSVNNSESSTVSIDALTRQKKKFKFRKHRSQIGGDINIAHTIHLKKRSYTVVLNADAMGKSIQGAGGALVLGSVFQSILERTGRSSQAQDVYPERWLKNTFVELNDVFYSFNGSMLLSLILGLIDDENGLFYFINAEHPWAILFRDGVSSFLENELLLRKLGTEKMDEKVTVRTFQMQQGDAILLGSDGRDDILQEVAGKKEKVINHDESQILRHIEKSKADLVTIYKTLRKAGELIDDLSLLKITYHKKGSYVEDVNKFAGLEVLLKNAAVYIKEENLAAAEKVLKQAYRLSPMNVQVIKTITNFYFKTKKYEKASYFAEKQLALDASNELLIYHAAVSSYRAGKYQKAIDLGERMKLREPTHEKNLLNLARAYFADGNVTRSRKILDKLLELNPKHEKAKAFQDKINEE